MFLIMSLMSFYFPISFLHSEKKPGNCQKAYKEIFSLVKYLWENPIRIYIRKSHRCVTFLIHAALNVCALSEEI